MERVIIDSGVVIAVERGVIEMPLGPGAALAAVSAAELLVGVELADERHRAGRSVRVEAVLEGLTVIPYDLAIAREHSRLSAHARRTGRPRGAHDLQIAATARATGRTVLTTDRGAFDDLPGVKVRVLG